MKKPISLNQYLSMGGRLESINIEETTCIYSGSNNHLGKRIIAITENGMNRDCTAILYKCNFEGNTSHLYAAVWIETTVDLELSSKYK